MVGALSYSWIGVKRPRCGKFGRSSALSSSRFSCPLLDGSQAGLVHCVRERRGIANRFLTGVQLLSIGVYTRGRFALREVFGSVKYLVTDLYISPMRCAGVRLSSRRPM